jgi:hypothetical protein
MKAPISSKGTEIFNLNVAVDDRLGSSFFRRILSNLQLERLIVSLL